MAAVRFATRRLGGSLLQGRQVAVAEERRRLVHTDESAREQVILEIQQKKEELYDAISRADKKFIKTRWNSELAQDLSVQVTPRPFDSTWRRLRLAKRVNGFLLTAGHCSLSSILAVTVYLGWPLEEEENAAQPPPNKQGQ